MKFIAKKEQIVDILQMGAAIAERRQTIPILANLRIKASTRLISKLTPILEEYSKKNSIRIIIQKKQIVMGTKEDDITKDILELVNQKIKNIKLD